MFENQERQASKKFYNKSSENSRSQIVFRTDIFRKLTLGAPEWIHSRFGKAVKGLNCALMAGLPTSKREDSISFCLLVHVKCPPFSTITDLNRSSLTGYWKLEKFHLPLKQLLKRDKGTDALLPCTSQPWRYLRNKVEL